MEEFSELEHTIESPLSVGLTGTAFEILNTQQSEILGVRCTKSLLGSIIDLWENKKDSITVYWISSQVEIVLNF